MIIYKTSTDYTEEQKPDPSSDQRIEGDLLGTLWEYQKDPWLKRAIDGVRSKHPNTPEDEIVDYLELLDDQATSDRDPSQVYKLKEDPEAEANLHDIPSIKFPVKFYEGGNGMNGCFVQPFVPILVKARNENEGLGILERLKEEFGSSSLYFGRSPLGYWVRGIVLVGREKIPFDRWREHWYSISRDLLHMGVINEKCTSHPSSALFLSHDPRARIAKGYQEVTPYSTTLSYDHFRMALRELIWDLIDPNMIKEADIDCFPTTWVAMIEGYLEVVENESILITEDDGEWLHTAVSLIHFCRLNMEYALNLYDRLHRFRADYDREEVLRSFCEALFTVRSQLIEDPYGMEIIWILDDKTGWCPNDVSTLTEAAQAFPPFTTPNAAL